MSTDIRLTELIDTRTLSNLADMFNKLSDGISLGMTDEKGTIIVSAPWQVICDKFHRENDAVKKLCAESYENVTPYLRTKKFHEYVCKNGLREIVFPILVENEHLGNLFIGQFLYDDEPPDIAGFTQRARLYGFPEKPYLDALSQVPRHSWESMRVNIQYCLSITAMIEQAVIGKLELQRELIEQKKLKEELYEAAAAVDKANNIKNLFLANISHELRTPLNGIIGMASLLEDTPLSEEQREYLSLLSRSGEDLLDLVNNLLDLAKLEEKKLTLTRKRFNLLSACKTCLSIIKSSAEKKGLELLFSFESFTGEERVGDELRIKQILLNLLFNAVKFSLKGSVKLTISDKGDKGVLLSVADSGIGIPKNKQEELFQNFWQLENPYTKAYKGAGIGLSIVRQLSEAMGGSVWLESEPNKGTIFHVALRIFTPADHVCDEPHKVESAIRRPALSDSENLPPFRVLVAEDEVIGRMYIRKLLSKKGWHVDEAQNGIEALEKVRSAHYDLILMDLGMPKMNGIEATLLMRDAEITDPIIALTAHVSDEDRRYCLEAGMDDYIAKPVNESELFSKIKMLVSTRRK